MIKTENLLFTGGIVQIQAKGTTPAVSIVAYTGGVMDVPGWGPLVINLDGIDLSAPQISILADHDATLKGIVGHGQAQVRNGKLIVTGTLTPTTEAARQVIELAKSGFLFQASVGVDPGETSRVRKGEMVQVNGRAFRPSQDLTLIKTSTLKEVSIVVIGADGSTSVAIAASSHRDKSMTEKTVEELRTEAAVETERINAIRKACDGHYADIEVQAIREGWDEQKTQLAVLRASRPKAPMVNSGRHYASHQSVIEAAILAHMGHEDIAEKHLGPHAAQQARDMRVTSLVDLCKAALQLDGHVAPSGREALIRAAMST